MEIFSKHIKPFWLLLAGLVIAVVCIWQVTRLTYEVELKNILDTGEERLNLYASTLREALSRYASLPYVLARDPAVHKVLNNETDADQLNRYLDDLNREAGSDALYIMDAHGITKASSNWRESYSYIGHNYGYRPYFTATKAGHMGRFFAIGATTGRPGYFISCPVQQAGKFIGAAIVKVNLDPLQDDWRKGGEIVMVSDANGVLFLSSNNAWKYHTLAVLTPEQRQLISAGRQYGSQPLNPLPLQTLESLDAGHSIVRIGAIRYLLLARQLDHPGWRLLHLIPLRQVVQHSSAAGIIATASVLLFIALGMYARERQQKKLSRRKAREAEAIKAVNLRLQKEIEEHCRTEQILRETQAELVQNSKLAALGQMAAGIVHELNQPIGAIRTHAASARLLLDRGNPEQLRETLTSVSKITDHMASITAQLKSFATKTPQRQETVLFQDCLEAVLHMLAPLLDGAGVQLNKHVYEEPLLLQGSRGQVEQVLVNLIRNAVDAMHNSTKKILEIKLRRTENHLELCVRDSGPGIAQDHMDELFDPFFTTKEIGQGLGLGLSISYRIVDDLGGSIRAANNADVGATFTVRLPLLSEEEQNDK
ncbi:MAG: sensor histidine kinase [Desulfuromonadaceae bacterium]